MNRGNAEQSRRLGILKFVFFQMAMETQNKNATFYYHFDGL